MINQYYWSLAQRCAAKCSLPAAWIYAQWVHETGGFTSALCTKYNNLGGVTQEEPNNTPQPDGNCYYMQFVPPEAYADYFAWYLSQYDADGIYQAQSIAECATALKNGGYFGDTLENYIAGMTAAYEEAFE